MMLIVEYLLQTEETDGRSMEGVSEPGASVDIADSEDIHRASPGLCERGEKVDSAAAKKVEAAEMEEKETETAVDPSPVSPPDLSTSQSSFSTQEEVSGVLAQGDEPDSTAESDKEGTEVKMEEDHEPNKDHVSQTLEENLTGPDSSVDTNMDKMFDHSQEKTDTDVDTRQENASPVCKFRVSAADDLDEMMDIGTVDQVEQEAHMKEEEGNRSMDRECSPGAPSPGNLSIVLYLYLTPHCFST